MQVTLRVMSFVSMIKDMSINTAIVALLFSYYKLLYSVENSAESTLRSRESAYT